MSYLLYISVPRKADTVKEGGGGGGGLLNYKFVAKKSFGNQTNLFH